MFSCEFCEIFKNIFFTEHLWAAASNFSQMKNLYCNVMQIFELVYDEIIKKSYFFHLKYFPLCEFLNQTDKTFFRFII